MAMVMHRTLKNTFRCLSDKFQDWESALPMTLMAINNAINDEGISPSMLMFGTHQSIPFALCNTATNPSISQSEYFKQLSSTFKITRDSITTSQNAQNPSHNLPQFVYVKSQQRKNCLSPRYHGPYKVINSRGSVVTYLKDDEECKINMDLVKPAWIINNEPPMNDTDDEEDEYPDNTRIHHSPQPSTSQSHIPIAQRQLQSTANSPRGDCMPQSLIPRSIYGRAIRPVERY